MTYVRIVTFGISGCSLCASLITSLGENTGFCILLAASMTIFQMGSPYLGIFDVSLLVNCYLLILASGLTEMNILWTLVDSLECFSNPISV